MAERMTINDDDREQWIANEEGLYNAHRRSRKSMRTFIRENRADIDKIIRTATGSEEK